MGEGRDAHTVLQKGSLVGSRCVVGLLNSSIHGVRKQRKPLDVLL